MAEPHATTDRAADGAWGTCHANGHEYLMYRQTTSDRLIRVWVERDGEIAWERYEMPKMGEAGR